MPTYVILLRGINITGHRIVRMTELTAHVARCGATNVRTYIQSGNVVCEHPAKSCRKLGGIVEEYLVGKLGYRVKTFVRTVNEMKAIVENNPFDRNLPEFGRLMYVSFFERAPTPAAIASIQPFVGDRARLHINGRTGYVYYLDGLGRAKLSHTVIERNLGPTTMRNWNTVTALLEMTRDQVLVGRSK